MTQNELERAIQNLCDKSGLTTAEVSEVVGTLASQYADLAKDEDKS